MSGKRYNNVSESSSDEEYERRRYKNSEGSYGKSDYDDDFEEEENCKILKKADTSSSSFDMRMMKRGRGGNAGNSKRPCMNKNAQAARENRIRKKKHLEQVENKLSFYQQKNKRLVNVIQKQDIDIKKLKGEVTYLRCILKNNTNITALLQSMNEGLTKTSSNNNKMDKLLLFNNKSSLEKITTKINSKILTNNSEFDHTYTIPKIQTEDKMREDIENCKNNSTFQDDIFSAFNKEASMTPPRSNSDDVNNVNISDTEMNEWSSLNINIYDNFKPFDDILTPSDNMENLTNLYDDTNILEQFKDAGICLHVNSDKVSLEFCSICHMNSLNNSMPE